MTRRLGFALAAAVGLFMHARPAAADDTIKIGYAETLSGTFAQIGDEGIKTIQFVIDGINAKGGVLGKKLVLEPIDDKNQPADALVALQKMVDDNLPIILNCGPSNVAAALVDGVNKNNARNPDHRIVYVNCGAVAPELTNEKCSFWHFRTDAHAGMKAEIMVRALPKTVTKVYMINQDYLFGQAVQRNLHMFLKKLRPDITIVGDELVPLGKIKDFTPYITKVQASGAQALLTGNWGPDMTLLIRAGMDAGLPIDYYTYYAHLAGGPTAIGPEGNNKVHSVMAFNENIGVETHNAKLDAWIQEFRKRFDFDFVFGDRRLGVELIAAAINKAQSTDPLKIALAMEGMKLTDAAGHEAIMRKADHQILMTYYLGTFTKDVKYDSEHTGLGWRTDATIPASAIDQPTTCKMKRPTS
ncbi:MAG: branched-chain amino acid ABC transporter substrate-binding protein [Acetobacteraceae bacterium]